MLPILFRYLLSSYFKIFSLCVGSFVSILIVSRFKEIARFAAVSGAGFKTFLFLLYQIPFILPFAFPLGALVSAFLLSHRMSKTAELSSLRASGVPFRSLLTPLFFAASLLAACSFSISSDLSPFCRSESKNLFFQETASNPFLLLKKQNLFKTSTYFKMNEKDTSEILLITPSKNTGHLQLFSASRLCRSGNELLGYDIAEIIPFAEKKDSSSFSPLFIENHAITSTPADVFTIGSTFFKKESPTLRPKDLSFRMLELQVIEKGKNSTKARVEIVQRLFLSFAVLTFTCLGFASGIHLPRLSSKQGILPLFFLTLIALIAHLSLKTIPIFFIVLFVAILPHFLIALFSWKKIRAATRGTL